MGIDGIGKPLETIEGMAKFYLNAIQQVQPRGPYFLIGHSLGGLVALEMAQQLTGQVEQVALLAMLDSYPHAGHLPIGPRARLFFSQTVARLQYCIVVPHRSGVGPEFTALPTALPSLRRCAVFATKLTRR
jgi:thioesterase domain-containing protein